MFAVVLEGIQEKMSPTKDQRVEQRNGMKMESTEREAKIKIVDGIRKPDNATKKAMTE